MGALSLRVSDLRCFRLTDETERPGPSKGKAAGGRVGRGNRQRGLCQGNRI
jgi:S-adenosylmethionine synthetase